MTPNPSTGDALKLAIRKEMEAERFYLEAASRVKNPLVRRRLLGLAGDEEVHRMTLSRLYWGQTGRDPGDVGSSGPAGEIPPVEKMTMEDVLRMAVEDERAAAAFYGDLAARVEDERTRLFLQYLEDFERGHMESLSRELERLEKNPGWLEMTEGKDPA